MPSQEILAAELKARDEFFSAVAHELRNPLNALHLTLAGLVRAQNGKTPLAADQVVSRLNRASAQVTRLAKLVDDMLDVSRISAGRFQFQLEEFDAVAVLKGVLEHDKDTSSAAMITFATPPALIMRCDKTRFAQVASNLIANAIQYGDQKPVEVRLHADKSAIYLEVVDHGIGIAAEDQERIFERFEKLGNDSPNVRFGIGLWIAREVVRALHGDIRVSSKVGEGSTFTMELPQLDSPTPAAPSG